MTNRFEQEDRSILEFRPKINFVEPEQEEGIIDPIEPDRPQYEDVQEARQRVKKLSQAVNALATAVQARVDKKADGMFILLDPVVDHDTVQAMARRFPGQNPQRITYAQYRECKNAIRQKGINAARQALITPEQIAKSRDKLSGALRTRGGGSGGTDGAVQPTGIGAVGSSLYVPGGYNKDGAESGTLRPELNKEGYVIEPLDIQQVQIDFICILVNYIWKEFIKPSMIGLPVVGLAIQALPDQLCDPGFDGDIPGLYILGQEPDDLLTGKVAAAVGQAAIAAIENAVEEG